MTLASMRDSFGLAVLLLAGMAISFVTAWGFSESEWIFFGASIPVSVAILGMSLRFSDIEFGSPELSCEQHVGEVLKAAPAMIIIGGHDFPQHGRPALKFPFFVLLCISHLVTGLNVRGAGLVVLALGHMLYATWTVAGIFNSAKEFTHVAVAVMVSTVLGVRTKYMHDQRLLFCISHVQLTGGVFYWRYYVRAPSLPFQVLISVLLSLVCYLILLCHRRLRNLPPALGAIAFVRLGFIRGDASCRGTVLRCQEMPAGAFGNVRKAMRLISVSHRWLDRHTCDVPTEAFPMGLRLGTMRRVLNTHFSPTRAEEPSFARRLRHAIVRRAVGGWDAVVFYDFAGLPQVPRSQDEDAAFRRCLPHMGMMYSMFPTMVLHEVPPGTHGYLESGWCYCEFETARLGRQLSEYSRDALAALGRARALEAQAGGDVLNLEEMASMWEAELAQKRFHVPSDADDVRRIIKAFAMKRMMLDAIEAGDTEHLRSVMSRLKGQNLVHATLDQPVNAALETLLHVAVRKCSAAAAQILLDSGASPTRRNLRGDMAAQCFMFPRCSRAAQLARTTSTPGSAQGEVIGRVAQDDGAL